MLHRRDFLAQISCVSVSIAMFNSGAFAKSSGKPGLIASILEEVSRDLLRECPDGASFMGVDVGQLASLRGQLRDRSIAGDAVHARTCKERLQRLKAVDRVGLTTADLTNLDTVIYAHELAAEGYSKFRFGDNAAVGTWQMQTLSPYIVSQASGSFATVPDFLDTQHRIEVRRDAEAYLSRLHQFARNLDGETAIISRDAKAGVAPPSFILDTVISQYEDYLAQKVPDWKIVTSLADRARQKHIRGAWKSRAIAICDKVVKPALERQLKEFKGLRAVATDDAGCWKFPDGDAYYAWALKAGTTTSLTPEEVHQAGLTEVRELADQMDKLLLAQGLSQGTVAARMAALGEDKRFLYPNNDMGKAQLLAYLNEQIAQMRSRLPEIFHHLPKTDLVIKRVPQAMEAGAPAAYAVDGSLDGKTPAYYYINLIDTGRWPKFTLPTLSFHEGVPGHVLQGGYILNLPTIRSQLNFNAYAEGWALYAEQLADEIGMYTDDPFARLGYLQSIQFRACRLVVDTGIHFKRWTREQAANWLVEHNGMTLPSAISEVDRYCAWPGQACGYRIGQESILKLRNLAKSSLGPRFDIRAFNDAILMAGPTPLAVLEGVVQEFIRSNAGDHAVARKS